MLLQFITSWQINAKTMESVTDFISWAPKSLQMVTAAMKLKDACSLEEKLWPPRQHIKKQRHYFANKGPTRQSYGFSSCHVWMWKLDYKESWAHKIWCSWTVVLEKTLVARRSNQWILRKSVLNIHWKNWCWNSNTLATWCEELTHWKRPWCWEKLKAGEEGSTEDELVGWYHWLNGHEFEKAPEVGGVQGSMTCWSPWGHKESYMTEQLNWIDWWMLPFSKSNSPTQALIKSVWYHTLKWV